MKIAIITVAGISSRFNEGIPEEEKKLKAVYFEENPKNTLLYHLLQKCSYAGKIVIVGGYKFTDLQEYCSNLDPDMQGKLSLVYNEHYEDLGSGYSLYLGLLEAFRHNPEEILFVEGDLDIDDESFQQVVRSSKSVLTFTHEPIYANKAVVLYRDDREHYRYAFNSSHGLLQIDAAFSCILNSGQTWKFTDAAKLAAANEKFYETEKDGTNLRIIQHYLDADADVDLIALTRWTNCNTRADYRKILSGWEKQR